jgi:prepilin-type N-terminal cleavage/methylation domain-containing protein
MVAPPAALKTVGRAGFTLIELSIVLIIVGLIIGGVLVGRDLIHAAEIRAAISEQENFRSAVGAFQSKYNCLPGDCPTALQFFGSACGDSTTDPITGCNGDGDGLVVEWPNYENFKFWLHLSLAKMVKGNFTGRAVNDPSLGDIPVVGVNIPRSGLNNMGWNAAACGNAMTPFAPPSSMNAFSLGGPPDPNNTSGTLACIPSWMSRQEAFTIDSKIDDGLPDSGKVFGDGGQDCWGASYFVFNGAEDTETKDCTLSLYW